ncbi:MAG: hypothetical protein G5Z42_07080 [Caldisphaeraceae archaeon]|nr:hypothetical protein [Caldisphaeraceae archaeon]MEB3691796.1 hypothetical protein [Caldisphaeraceae archaeon]MEB3798560.1 hypothetical protein [Caldisphaeraceae archaeon]
MHDNRLVLIMVPGRNDRAFYKAFLLKMSRGHGLGIIDVDQYEEEKYHVLAQAFQIDEASPIRRSSVLKVNIGKGRKEIYVIVLPTEGNVVEKACDVLKYQSGLFPPAIDYLAVAEDAEDRCFRERLDSLRDSLRSRGCIKIKEEQEQGRHFRLYALKEPKNVKLMLLVQGVEQGLDLVDKHAVEDYVLYPHKPYVQEIAKNCPKLIDRISHGRHAHKKMALLMTIYMCYKNLEEAFFNGLDEQELEVLVKSNDGLATLIKSIEQLVKS